MVIRSLLAAAALTAVPLQARFVLASSDRVAPLVLGTDEPAFLRVAANDLVSDVRAIAGRTIPIAVSREACKPQCLMLASASIPASRALIDNISPGLAVELDGKLESSRSILIGDVLLIAGSDPHGTMFGLYEFIERALRVDPMYFWSGRAPEKRSKLAWDKWDHRTGAPSFRWRGWFINDEDLLTEWKDEGGPRDIDYPYYAQVTAHDVLERVMEAAVRLRFNLIIPASFTDILNPAEERMVQQAVRRGLHVSMHHVEPMGVSAFAFFNYWRARGRDMEYSYSRHPEAFEEVWRHYAERWAKYPGVVWQVGLRGIADRPVWLADKTAPQTDEGRGRMISDAIATQMRIIREVDKRPDPPVTTTLWMEGAYLFQGGHLKLPREVTVVFADNGPGWNWQQDFHETPRETGRSYGVYYHHAVWGFGPHLVQAVPPKVTHRMLAEAHEKNGGHYAIFNVANVREFVLGLAATSEMTWRFSSFQPDEFLRDWCRQRFGDKADEAEAAYRAFFDAYVLNEKRGTPDLLDGIALHEGERMVQLMLKGENDALYRELPEAAEFSRRSFSHLRRTGEEAPPQLMARVQRQIAGLDRALELAHAAGRDPLLETNLVGQVRILRGICLWDLSLARASMALRAGDRDEARKHVAAALRAFDETRAGQALNSQGIWRDWYRGDKKMNLNRAEQWTRQLMEKL